MRKMFLTVVAVIVVAIAGLLAYAATLPTLFNVSRSIEISAPPEKIFPHINSLRRMNVWNPFAKKDPAIKLAYSGPEAGKGASYTWAGNSNVGEGRLEIAESSTPTRVTMQLDMLKPLEAHNTVVFTLRPTTPNNTAVTWAMTGDRPFIGKVLDAVLNMDRMVGGEFEAGLADLKAQAEK